MYLEYKAHVLAPRRHVASAGNIYCCCRLVLFFVLGVVFHSGFSECFSSLEACGTASTVDFSAAIAAPSLRVVYLKAVSDACDVGLCDVCIWGVNLYVVVCPCFCCGIDGADEFRSAVGVYAVVAAVIGDEESLQSVRLCYAGSDGEHDAVAEGYDGGAYVIVVVVALGYGVVAFKKTALEVVCEELEGNDYVFYPEELAVVCSAFDFPGIMIAAIVERHGKCNLFFVVVEHCDGIHSAADDDE